MLDKEGIITLITAIIGSGAIFTFIQFLISRKDAKNQKLDKVMETVADVKRNVDEGFSNTDSRIELLRIDMNTNDEALRASLEETKATTARVRILRASDEILHKMRHSKEWFDQINDDITFYEVYCQEHPEFINNKAKHAIENINRVYSELLQNNDFL